MSFHCRSPIKIQQSSYSSAGMLHCLLLFHGLPWFSMVTGKRADMRMSFKFNQLCNWIMIILKRCVKWCLMTLAACFLLSGHLFDPQSCSSWFAVSWWEIAQLWIFERCEWAFLCSVCPALEQASLSSAPQWPPHLPHLDYCLVLLRTNMFEQFGGFVELPHSGSTQLFVATIFFLLWIPCCALVVRD